MSNFVSISFYFSLFSSVLQCYSYYQKIILRQGPTFFKMGGMLIAYNKIPHSLKSLDTDFSRFSSDPQTSQDCSPRGVATVPSMTVARPSPPVIHAAFNIAAFRLQLVISPQHGPQHTATSLEFTFPVYLCPSQFQKGNSEVALGFSHSTDNQSPTQNSQTPQEPGKAGDLVPLPHCPRQVPRVTGMPFLPFRGGEDELSS